MRFDFSKHFGRAWIKGMTMVNINGGFKTTGVYPVNRNVLKPVKEAEGAVCPRNLEERTGLKLIPLYSRKADKGIPFSDEEMSLYQRQLEEGYDLEGDSRYNMWFRMYSPYGMRSPEASPKLILHPML
jgi:hypothetical protein